MDVGEVTLAVSTTGLTPEILTPNCDVNRDDLYLVTKTYRDFATSAYCAALILRGTTARDIRKHCQIVCRPEKSRSRVVHALSSNKFLIVHSKTTLPVICTNQNFTVEGDIEYGSLEVTLPCNCRIVLAPGKEVKPAFPCVGRNVTFRAVQVIPLAWVSVPTMGLEPYDTQVSPHFASVNDFLDTTAANETQGHDQGWQAYFLWTLILVSLILNITTSTIFWKKFVQNKTPAVPPPAPRFQRQPSGIAVPRPMAARPGEPSDGSSSSGYVTPIPGNRSVHPESLYDGLYDEPREPTQSYNYH